MGDIKNAELFNGGICNTIDLYIFILVVLSVHDKWFWSHGRVECATLLNIPHRKKSWEHFETNLFYQK